MYKSLRKYMRVPLTVKPKATINGAGDKTYGISINTVCYPEHKVNVVVGTLGTEVISNTTLYVDGRVVISDDSTIVYDNKEYPIKAIGAFFDKDARDLWVVYI